MDSLTSQLAAAESSAAAANSAAASGLTAAQVEVEVLTSQLASVKQEWESEKSKYVSVCVRAEGRRVCLPWLYLLCCCCVKCMYR